MALTLSIEKRAFLDYIHSWTGVSDSGFIGGDFYLAYILDTSVDEAKQIRYELIKEGYLQNKSEKDALMELIPTDKEYTPLFSDMKCINREYIRGQLKSMKNNQNSLEQDINGLIMTRFDAKLNQIESVLKEIQKKLK